MKVSLHPDRQRDRQQSSRSPFVPTAVFYSCTLYCIGGVSRPHRTAPPEWASEAQWNERVISDLIHPLTNPPFWDGKTIIFYCNRRRCRLECLETGIATLLIVGLNNLLQLILEYHSEHNHRPIQVFIIQRMKRHAQHCNCSQLIACIRPCPALPCSNASIIRNPIIIRLCTSSLRWCCLQSFY